MFDWSWSPVLALHWLIDVGSLALDVSSSLVPFWTIVPGRFRRVQLTKVHSESTFYLWFPLVGFPLLAMVPKADRRLFVGL